LTDRPTYAVKFATAVKSDVRELDKQLQRIIKEEHLTRIEREPFNAVPLLYELRGLWSYIILTTKELNAESYMKSILRNKLF